MSKDNVAISSSPARDGAIACFRITNACSMNRFKLSPYQQGNPVW
ncbi:MAG TPA: hypothetical protein V6D10_17555 [Trichocoleus sp.]